ncbi:MAG: peptide ABC transporter substrate-binding protein [Patescibacteria group bacterium]
MIIKIIQILSNLNKNERLIFGGALLVFCASAIFIGWRFYISKTIVVANFGGTYTEGIVGQPALINPVNAVNEIDRDLITILFSNLLQLTDSYKVSADNKTWIISLKKDLFWDDGQKLTADDVVFTIQTIQDQNAQSPIYHQWQDVLAERLDENEIRLTLKNPYAFFIDNLKELRPIPKHIFADIPVTNFRLSNYNLEPVGSGPYKYLALKKEKNGFITKYKFEINPKFYGEKPYIENLNFKFFNNIDDLINSLNKGEIIAAGGLDADITQKIKRNVQSFQINIPRYYALFFNLSDTSPLIKNREVRWALSLAIDKNKIINSALHNGAMIINGPIFPGLEGYNQDFYKKNTFNIEEAKKTLAAANLKFPSTGGPMIDLIIPRISFLTDTANIIKENWEELGLKVNLIIIDSNDIVNQYIKTRNYSAIIFGNILKSNSDVYSFWHSNERFFPGLNLSLYNNKEVDSLLESIQKENSPPIRQKKLLSLQQKITEDQPAIFLFSPSYYYVTTKDLNGFKPNFLASANDRFTDINKWYLKTTRKFK